MVIVSKYSSEYRRGVRDVCVKTAFFGEPLSKWLDIHPELYADLFTRYYTDFEPEGLLIALDRNRVIGYMALCSDLNRQKRILNKKILPDIFRHIIEGRYCIGNKIIWLLFRMLADRLRFGSLNLRPKGYNADIHINFLFGYRGIYSAWGKMVLIGYRYLKKKNVRYIIGVLFQDWENPEGKMSLLGFKTIQKRRTTIKRRKGWFLITGCDLFEWQRELPKAIAIFTKRKKMLL
ncbi:MAG: hypothetical protein ACUVWP_04050 [bacterium]